MAAAVAAALAGQVPARAEGWRSQQPPAPPPPEGQTGPGVPVALGHIGQVSFWAPNRGLLITAGTEAEGGPVQAGLYYYNGVAWRRLSTVCGGSDGRIAWAGENDFWTISDQQAGQQFQGNSEGARQDVSLCHFQNGRVVASYAEPIGVPGSYRPMHAAACSGPEDCWFGGDVLPAGANAGAFHLHWNGRAMVALPSLEAPEPQLEDPPHVVQSMAFFRGRLYESVQVEQASPGEPSQPYLIHQIAEGSSKPFVSIDIEGPPEEAFSYPASEPALQLSGDSAGLWAAGASTVVLDAKGRFQPLKLSDPARVLAGAVIGAIASEPGTEDAWASIDPTSGPEGINGASRALTRVTRIHADGAVDPPNLLPEAGETLGHKGAAGAIACPAAGDCWVASSQGWLFHLGPNHAEDTDPYFQSVITYRPADPSIPFLAPESFPEDDSGANPPPIPAPTPPPVREPEAMVRAPLFSHVKERLVGRTTIALSFTLATRSRVRLLARRRHRTVARTADRVLGAGRHTLRLRLNRRAWPTGLNLQVHALAPVPLIPAGASAPKAAGGPTAVTTAYRPDTAAGRAAAAGEQGSAGG
jgi:hypothetical protein